MIKFILIIVSTISISLSYAQNNIEIANNVFINFIDKPIYKEGYKVSTYSLKDSDNIYIVTIQHHFLPNYSKYLSAQKKWTKAEKESVESTFLTNIIKGKLNYSNSKGKALDLKLGSSNTKKIEYKVLNPISQKKENRASIVLFKNNEIISFDVVQIFENQKSEKNKSNFFNSIKIY